ncbi:hypothetical protein [uncultured Aquimarina sp.]|uniref:hypothetical protein n=1 Tax=uncultured Aquimarina sp. TaxID=575652 RepID=UPI0026305D64|nr:hypothetical protein [uncultured Aquimarina sp.]
MKTEDGSQESEDRRQKSEDRSQRSEDGRRKKKLYFGQLTSDFGHKNKKHLTSDIRLQA